MWIGTQFLLLPSWALPEAASSTPDLPTDVGSTLNLETSSVWQCCLTSHGWSPEGSCSLPNQQHSKVLFHTSSTRGSDRPSPQPCRKALCAICQCVPTRRKSLHPNRFYPILCTLFPNAQLNVAETVQGERLSPLQKGALVTTRRDLHPCTSGGVHLRDSDQPPKI